MKKTVMIIGLVFLTAACSPVSKEAKQDMAKPINCATAEGDIRALNSEKVQLPFTSNYPVTYNDPELTERSVASLARVAGGDNVTVVPLETGAEDFAFFAQEVPSFYYFLGGKPLDVPASEAASHHTPDFFIDESGLALGVESMLAVALDYLNGANPITEQ